MTPRLAAALAAALALHAAPVSAARAPAPAADAFRAAPAAPGGHALAAPGGHALAAPGGRAPAAPGDHALAAPGGHALATPADPGPPVRAGDSAATLPGAGAAPGTPFPTIPLEPSAPPRSHLGAWLVLAAGAGLVGASFAVSESADRAYADYLRATDPSEIERLFDLTRRRDRIAGAALIGGQVLVATAVWMRFLREPRASRLAIAAGPERCAVTLRF